MSAFVVDPHHIDAILTYASNKKFEGASDLNHLGQMLLDENIRSVNHRYSEADEAIPYTFRFRIKPMSAVQFIKAVQCLKYQSCETDDWKETQAHKVLESFTANALSQLPGYDSAEWEIQQ